MSDMYRQEVPQYGTLLDLVADINADVLAGSPELRDSLARSASLERLNLERHGAIRLGTAAELATMRRVFAVMGMEPVGYYDLSVAGIPVHSTAFRPVGDAALAANPFRVFTRCCDWNCSKTRRWPPRRARSCNGATSSRRARWR